MKYSYIILVLSALLILNCEQQEMKKHVVICFDVEDYITPESDNIDVITKWIAETMTEEDVKGMFFVIGEKARSLEKRGRNDVIEAMKKHGIGLHTNRGSIHPTVTETLENMNFKDGLDLMKKIESQGFNDLEHIFDQQITTYARHGGSYGPQLVAALSELNASYIYAPVFLPGHYVSWFCNTLNFYGDGYEGFDDTYYKDEFFNPRFDTLKSRLSSYLDGTDGLTFFGAHPCKIRTIQYWDFNYYYGANPDSTAWKTPELRPAASMKTARKNFRKLIRYFKSRDDIELTTFDDLMKLYSYQRQKISVNDLQTIANRIIEEKTVVIDDYYSAAEVFAALAGMISENENGSLPEHLKIIRPFGPLIMPEIEPSLKKLPKESVVELAFKALDYIHNNNALPSSLEYDGKSVGTGSLLALFSQFFLDIINGKIVDIYSVQPFDSYPHKNETAIVKNVENCKTWPVHRKDLDMTNIIENTKMQLWTLKPAWRNKTIHN